MPISQCLWQFTNSQRQRHTILRSKLFLRARIFSITALGRLEHSADPKRSQHAGHLVSNQRITLPSVHSTASRVLPCSRENKCERNVIHDLRKGSHQANRDKQHRDMLAKRHRHQHLLLTTRL